MRRAFGMGASAVLLLAMASPVIANGPYLEPTVFGTNRDFVTIQAAHGAEVAFQAMGPIRTLGDFFATGPDGETANIGPGMALKGMSIIEPHLSQEGTWKISTGERLQRTSKAVLIDGAWRQVRPPQPAGRAGPAPKANPNQIDEANVPAGAEAAMSSGYLRSDVYVTRGAPTGGAVKPTNAGFELWPQTHPNEIFLGDAFKFTLLNDGQGVGGVEFNIRRAGDVYAEGSMFSLSGKTDAQGKASVTLPTAGRYILETSYPAQAPQGQKPVPKTTNYSMTFEVSR